MKRTILAVWVCLSVVPSGACCMKRWWSMSWEKNSVLDPCVIELGLLQEV